jgi:hypothetical protein
VRLASHVQRIALLVLVGLLVGLPSLGFGCAGGPDAAESALRLRFPAQAGRVLDDGDGFAATGGGFESPRGAGEGRLRAILPGSGEGSIELAIAATGGEEPFSIRVREVGATGAAAIAGRAIAYRRAAVGARIELTIDEPGDVLVDPARIATGAMSVTRQSHTAVLLSSGDVVVVDVDNGTGYRITGETHSATTGAWSPAGSMTEARTAHAATAIGGGKVLVSGGRGISVPHRRPLRSPDRLLQPAEAQRRALRRWRSLHPVDSCKSGACQGKSPIVCAAIDAGLKGGLSTRRRSSKSHRPRSYSRSKGGRCALRRALREATRSHRAGG